MDVTLQDVELCIPLCRQEILSNVCQREYGDIDQIWELPGHLFLTTDNGNKLFTFDCKPLSYQHQNVFDSRSLDTNLSSPLVNVVKVTPEVIALIEQNGCVNFWKFGQDFSWILVGNLNLCSRNKSEISSVAYLSSHNLIVWCEKQQPIVSTISPNAHYTNQLCKKVLPQVISSQDDLDNSSTSIFLHNCPPCDVFALSKDVLFVTTSYDHEQISLHLLFDFTNGLTYLYAGSYNTSFHGQSGEDFVDIITNNLSNIIQAELGLDDLGVKVDATESQVATLNSEKCVELYSCQSDSFKRKITRQTINLSIPSCETLPLGDTYWFLHKAHIGIILQTTLYLYRLTDGKQICQVDFLVNNKINKVISSQCPLIFAWVLTADELLALQITKTTDKEPCSETDQQLPDEHILQTDILKLVHLHELKSKEYNYQVIQELQEIKASCADIKHAQNHSQIATLIAPYWEDYWKLENLSKTIVDSKVIKIFPETKTSGSAVQILMENRNFTMTSRHTKLIWLSQIYPKELLDYLCQGINYETTDVDATEMRQWQCLLGLEGGDLLNFEFVCRLLHQLYPEKLFNFVKNAESVCEHTVGVSAFVRKKHSLMYYATACECLPPNHLSGNPPVAAAVKAKLILASERQGCFEKALKHLLQHKLWSEAIVLIQTNLREKEKLTSYLHILITALAQDQVLDNFVPQLFSLFPTWKTVLSFANIAAEQPAIRQQQLSISARDLFPINSRDLKLASVKPYLLELVKKVNDV
ncbi:Hermansky-Pudlak syndrome 6 protein [Biomphalaria glabrata]|nr:Hermansky-Pudlak syndrome 6 protein [Biomphalaria glabrata]